MKFPEDPEVERQKREAEAAKIEEMQKGARSDTSTIDRVFGGNAIRRAAFGKGLV